MKKFIKVVLSLVAVLAAIAGILAGLKLFLEKFGKKKTETEEFTFEGDDLEDIELYSEDDTVEINLDSEETAE